MTPSTSAAFSGAGGTAYFWNEAGQDSVVLGNVVSNGAGGAGVAFGVTSGASLNISFLKGQTSAAFGAGAAAGSITDLFSVAASTKVRYGVSANGCRSPCPSTPVVARFRFRASRRQGPQSDHQRSQRRPRLVPQLSVLRSPIPTFS